MPAGDSENPVICPDPAVVHQAAVSDIADSLFARHQVSVEMLRLDQTDALLNGNKPFKLIPNLQQARAAGYDTVLSFGGAFSNHIHALAEAGRRFGFKTIAVIRGDDGQALSHTLQFAAAAGMRLIFVSRQQYRRRHDADFIAELKATVGNVYVIPEGGANDLGVHGSMQLATVIANSLPPDAAVDEVLLACGTGTTMAGLIAGLQRYPDATPAPFVRGIAVLKQGEFLHTDVARFIAMLNPAAAARAVSWHVETSLHWGGYARFPPALAAFMREFEHNHGILLDPVYTVKLVSAVYHRVAQGLYQPGSRLLLLHTGGLQGRGERCN